MKLPAAARKVWWSLDWPSIVQMAAAAKVTIEKGRSTHVWPTHAGAESTTRAV